MLTFRQLDDLSASITDSLEDTTQSIIVDMARRISRLGEVTPATNWQMLRLELVGAQQEQIIKELSRCLSMTEKQIEKMFDEAATRTIENDNRIYKEAGYESVALKDNPYLQQVISAELAKTKNAFKNLTRTTARTATKQFEDALDLAHMQIVTGTRDYQSAIKSVIKNLSQKGLNSIKYSSGKIDSLDVAARRAILTGINQTTGEIQIANMEMMGTDLVEVTAHHGARPSHAIWQGKVFSVSGTSLKYPSLREMTGYGTGDGLKGWGCRHDFFPYIEGVSEKAYTSQNLRKLSEQTTTYNGQKLSIYEATQQQRYIERQIRQWKRASNALKAGNVDYITAQRKVREWQARQRDFISQTGLRRDYFRERAGRQNLEIAS